MTETILQAIQIKYIRLHWKSAPTKGRSMLFAYHLMVLKASAEGVVQVMAPAK
jgi:hypothetical protein